MLTLPHAAAAYALLLPAKPAYTASAASSTFVTSTSLRYDHRPTSPYNQHPLQALTPTPTLHLPQPQPPLPLCCRRFASPPLYLPQPHAPFFRRYVVHRTVNLRPCTTSSFRHLRLYITLRLPLWPHRCRLHRTETASISTVTDSPTKTDTPTATSLQNDLIVETLSSPTTITELPATNALRPTHSSWCCFGCPLFSPSFPPLPKFIKI